MALGRAENGLTSATFGSLHEEARPWGASMARANRLGPVAAALVAAALLSGCADLRIGALSFRWDYEVYNDSDQPVSITLSISDGRAASGGRCNLYCETGDCYWRYEPGNVWRDESSHLRQHDAMEWRLESGQSHTDYCETESAADNDVLITARVRPSPGASAENNQEITHANERVEPGHDAHFHITYRFLGESLDEMDSLSVVER